MFRAFLCPSSGAYQLQQQPLVYRRNVVVAVLLVVVGPTGRTDHDQQHFVEKIYIKCNIWRVAVRLSYIQDARFLKVKLKK
jgi:hypothetical protein